MQIRPVSRDLRLIHLKPLQKLHPKVGSASLGCCYPLLIKPEEKIWIFMEGPRAKVQCSPAAGLPSSPSCKHRSSSMGCCNPSRGIFSWGSRCLIQPYATTLGSAARKARNSQPHASKPVSKPVPALQRHSPASKQPRGPLGHALSFGDVSMPETWFPGPRKISPRKIVSSEN